MVAENTCFFNFPAAARVWFNGFMIITIGGNLGAGKTTLANNLAEALGYEQLYVGGIFREMATEKGLSIKQFYAQLKNDPALEQAVDRRQAAAMHERDNLIVQGRVAWHFAKGSPFKVFNIFLSVDPAVGAKREAKKDDRTEVSADEDVTAATAERERLERERYAMLYGIKDHLDPQHYDFMLDTTTLAEKEVAQKVLAALPVEG